MAHHGSLAREERLRPSSASSAASCARLSRPRRWNSASTLAPSSWSARSIRPKSSPPRSSAIGRSGHSLDATPKGRFFALTTRRSARMRRGGARDSPRAARRSRDSRRMPRRCGAADCRDRRRRGRNRRGRSAAPPARRVQLRRPGPRTVCAICSNRWRPSCPSESGRRAENLLRSDGAPRPPAPRRATGRDHLGRHHSRERQLRCRDRIAGAQDRRRRRGFRAGVRARRRLLARLDAVADLAHLARTA